ncbi:MAG: energy transducer TonB [Treponema sp.]|jgi:protein TonB|nr:energy transducer TonB [Treponema sp.]
MRKINRMRLVLLLVVAGLHGIFLFSIVFTMKNELKNPESTANVMKLVDVRELPPPPVEPPPPPPPPPKLPPVVQQNTVEAVAETMIETDEPPPDVVVTEPLPEYELTPEPAMAEEIDYLPMHKISALPKFPEDEIRKALVYPPIALRSGRAGMVYLELFVDRQGTIQRINIIKEDPEGMGFGEAAVKAFQGIQGTPAEANGTTVAVRYRYPVRFTIR